MAFIDKMVNGFREFIIILASPTQENSKYDKEVYALVINPLNIQFF